MCKALDGKVAIITGASSGIGAATAVLFANEGARVVLFARRAAALNETAEKIRAAGGACIPVVGDVTLPDDCRRVFETAAQTYGRIDILINNAGEGDRHSTTAKTADALWYKMLELNQTAVFRFCREALQYMEKQDSGVIVNVSSIAGVYGNAGVSYSAAKHAVIGITKNIAIQYAGRGIRCNAVCPGPTLVPFMDGRDDDLFDKEFRTITERHMDMTVPMSDTASQADVILFLASAQSRSINGQAIVSDGGMCL
jgi:NAD(P)-dependent dehydrogenase (short-subunit alcohol dehydrogenase family)